MSHRTHTILWQQEKRTLWLQPAAVREAGVSRPSTVARALGSNWQWGRRQSSNSPCWDVPYSRIVYWRTPMLALLFVVEKHGWSIGSCDRPCVDRLKTCWSMPAAVHWPSAVACLYPWPHLSVQPKWDWEHIVGALWWFGLLDKSLRGDWPLDCEVRLYDYTITRFCDTPCYDCTPSWQGRRQHTCEGDANNTRRTRTERARKGQPWDEALLFADFVAEPPLWGCESRLPCPAKSAEGDVRSFNRLNWIYWYPSQPYE